RRSHEARSVDHGSRSYRTISTANANIAIKSAPARLCLQESETVRAMPEVRNPHPSPPRAEDYAVVPGSLGPRRDFRISVGLREGWDAEGRVFDVSEAVRTARAWMKRRV